MIEFEDPNDAFNPSGLRIQTGQYGSFSIYKLSDTIKGHEVLVASANNKAVENITKELPALSAIGRSLNELSYFNSIGDVVNNPVQMDKNGRPKMKQPDPIKTWGLISACLGNSNNLRAFLNSFWWNDDYSLKQYLKAAKGDPVYAKGKNGEPDRISKIITNEKPPSPLASKQNWKKACERFISLKKDYEDEIAKLERQKILPSKSKNKK